MEVQPYHNAQVLSSMLFVYCCWSASSCVNKSPGWLAQLGLNLSESISHRALADQKKNFTSMDRRRV
ncbi:hypothetical protein PGTUg99_027108 [Puccinia graminis f. sp. tritici]|uniref:Uncharacterized protein n=1 Tax=Puccinia graminis f. sp. tritici TaxID=56615 RepID=A0A5B0S5B4_PUCGR|nr:hypothetical protein PGTUg99_027108 [Puccinia graminis f. sp. tritici]